MPVHSAVIDETNLATKQLSIRIYDGAGLLVATLTLATDLATADVVQITAPPPPPVTTPSPDGTTISGGSGSLKSAAGTWSFGAPVAAAPGNWAILLNGSSVAGAAGNVIEVANGGVLYVLGRTGAWFIWQGGKWVASGAPPAVTPPPPPPPPPAISADGTTSAAPGGAALVTANGSWTWGPAVSGRPGEYQINLNGAWTGTGMLIEVANGGKLYANTVNQGWFVWANGFTSSPAPGPVVPSSVTLTPANASLHDSSPTGTTVSTIAVPMSDGSAFAGSLAVSANNMVAISGTKTVLARGLTASDDGTQSFTITATQGGNSKSATLTVTVAHVAARAMILSLSPSSPQPPDNSPAGTVITTVTASYSDGTVPASVTLTSSDPILFAIRGMQIVLARALTAADDGTKHVTITASDGLGVLATARMFFG